MGRQLKPKAELAKRTNVSLAPDIIRLAKALQKERRESNRSAFLTNLIKEEQSRRHPTHGTQSRTAPRRPFEERVSEAVETLMEDFKGSSGLYNGALMCEYNLDMLAVC